MPYFIGMNSEVRYFLKLRCCICVRNRLLKPDPHKNFSGFTAHKARPTDASERGPDNKSYLMSGTVILPMLNNGARYQLELRCCTILNKLCMNRLSGLFHKKIHSLWNRPESLFLRMVQDVS